MDKYQSVIKFKNYIVRKVVFTANQKYIAPDKDIDMQVQFKTRLDYNKEYHTAAVELGCSIFEDLKEHHPFSLEIVMIGFFKYEANLEKEPLEKLLKVNATAILFPYLRSMVSNVTINSGFDPIILPVINVHKIFEKDDGEAKETVAIIDDSP